MEGTFIFLKKDSFGVWLDPKNPNTILTGAIRDKPTGFELIAITSTREGLYLAVEYYTRVNPHVRAATA